MLKSRENRVEGERICPLCRRTSFARVCAIHGEASKRHLATAFCYGCNLGPTQTARSLRGLDRRHLAFINQRHVTEEKLDEAIVTVINAYARCGLQKLWGLGSSASADGTQWEIYPRNLLAEYHIRYGGYGGIGY